MTLGAAHSIADPSAIEKKWRRSYPVAFRRMGTGGSVIRAAFREIETNGRGGAFKLIVQ